MTTTHRFARLAFRIAGIYGLLVTLPPYWMEGGIGRDTPSALTHVEYFHDFIGVVTAWQLVFLVVLRNPSAFRPIMLVAIVEKLGFGIPAVVLYAKGRLATSALGFGLIDLVLASVFAIAYLRTDRPA